MTSSRPLLARVLLTVAGGAAAVAIGIALLLGAISTLRASARATLQSDSYLVGVIEIERSVVDAETGLRGYIITGDPVFLTPLNAAERQLPGEATTLLQRARIVGAFVPQARALSTAANAYLADYVVLRLGEMRTNPAAARTLAATLQGKRIVDGIRLQTTTLQDMVSAALTARGKAARNSANRAVAEGVAVLVLLTLMAIVLGGILGRLFLSRERSRERSAFLADASKQLDRATSVDQQLRTFVSLVDERLADSCTARTFAGEALDSIVLSEQASDGEAALVALADTEPMQSAVQRAHATATHNAVTASEHVRVRDGAGMVNAVVVAGMAHGRVVVEALLLRRGRGWTEADVAEAIELTTRMALAAHARALQVETAALYERSERTALTLQQSLLPHALPQIDQCELAVRFVPAGEGDLVGGDFYDVFAVGPDQWALVVGDVCGKGAVAAAVTAMARWTLRSLSGTAAAPSEALRFLNQAMLRQDLAGRFITVAYLLVTIRDGEAHVSVAAGGHPPPVLVPASGVPAPIPVQGDLIGIWPDVRVTDTEVRLTAGDALVVYTDGVTDQGPETAASPAEALSDHPSQSSAAALAHSLEQHAISTGGPGPRRDDIAILALRFTGLVTESDTAPQTIPAAHGH